MAIINIKFFPIFLLIIITVAINVYGFKNVPDYDDVLHVLKEENQKPRANLDLAVMAEQKPINAKIVPDYEDVVHTLEETRQNQQANSETAAVKPPSKYADIFQILEEARKKQRANSDTAIIKSATVEEGGGGGAGPRRSSTSASKPTGPYAGYTFSSIEAGHPIPAFLPTKMAIVPINARRHSKKDAGLKRKSTKILRNIIAAKRIGSVLARRNWRPNKLYNLLSLTTAGKNANRRRLSTN